MPVIFDEPLRVLVLPGWQNSGPGHWQSRWEALHGFQRVQQADWLWPRRGDWMAQLEAAVLDDPTTRGAPGEAPLPVVLVAHSLGCHLVSAWAAHTRHAARVRAALLVALPDTARADTPPHLAGWRQRLGRPLPFAAQAVVSTDDPTCTPERALEMATDWGAPVLQLAGAGHINADSGLGDWPQGLAVLQALVQRARR